MTTCQQSILLNWKPNEDYCRKTMKVVRFRNHIHRNHVLLVMEPIPEEPRGYDDPEKILSRNHDRKDEDSALHEARHAEGNHPRKN